MTTLNGTCISYHNDQTGRVARIKHGIFGEAVYDYDADGLITELTGETGTTTTYTYDDGQQLIAAVTGDTETTWSYDQAGRMTAHTTAAGTTSYVYDQAGQLLMVKRPDGVVTTYEYDGQGQRIHERSDRAATTYTWDARGWLRGIFVETDDGRTETQLTVNALGELTDVNDARMNWDIAAGVPSLLDVDGTLVFTGPAGVTGINTSWQKPLWRAARGTDQQDPWQTLAAVSAHAGIGLGTGGSLQIAGLEWMGARAYDPTSASFLSQDPIVAPLGVSWAANPYSYAGNDPLHAIDPHGLAPVTDRELQAYADGLQGPLASSLRSAWDGVTGAANSFVGWVEDNAIAIGAGLMVAGGVALMFTGVGGPAGLALMAGAGAVMSAGGSMAFQKWQTGEVNWGNVGKDALIGMLGGGVTGLAGRGLTATARTIRPTALAPNASSATQTTYNVLRNSTTRSTISAGTGGAASNMANYGVSAGDNATWQGFIQSGTVGFATSGLGSYRVSRLTPVASRGMANWTKPLSSSEPGRRSAGPYTWGHLAGEVGVDRLGGGLQGATNELLRETGSNEPRQPLRAGIQGVVSEGGGYAPGLHAK